MEKKIVVSDLDQELVAALENRIAQGKELLQIEDSRSPQEVIRKLYDYINALSVENCSEKEIEEYAYKLGAVWGLMVEKEYGWSWKYFKHKDDELSGVYIVSPKNHFCCSPLSLIYDILAGNKKNTEGNKDNTVVLLFNTLDGADKRASARKYVLLA